MSNAVNNNCEVLVLCGVFADENEAYAEASDKIVFEHSANNFQKKLINGFKESVNTVNVISAPFVGSFPNKSKLIRFNKNDIGDSEHFTYVSFWNIWGYRNISRKNALKKSLKAYLKNSHAEKILIAAYSAHEPIVESAAFAKQIDSRVKLCLVVPDLPQYMNLSSKPSLIYKLMKKIDSKKINKYMNYVDSFMILTEHMKEPLNIGERPYVVAEGISEKETGLPCVNKNNDGFTYIVYTGKLLEKYGVINLVEAFKRLKDNNLRLVLCGDGDCENYIAAAAKSDKRILFPGKVSSEEALAWQSKASVLVNPRENKGEYVKYSFPSKIIEYLDTGKPVVAYLLKGMPQIYSEFIYEIDETDNPADAVFSAVRRALDDDEENIKKKYALFSDYSNKHLYYKNVALSLLKLNNML